MDLDAYIAAMNARAAAAIERHEANEAGIEVAKIKAIEGARAYIWNLGLEPAPNG